MRSCLRLALPAAVLLGACAPAPASTWLWPVCPVGTYRESDPCAHPDSFRLMPPVPVPEYPPVLLSAGVSGEVVVLFRLTPSLALDTTSLVVARSKIRLFDKAAVAFVKGLRLAGRPPLTSPDSLHVIRVVFQIIPTCAARETTLLVTWLRESLPPTVLVAACEWRRIQRDTVH